MIAFEKTAKVSSKGQITLPKQVRSVLQSDFVRVVVEDGAGPYGTSTGSRWQSFQVRQGQASPE